MDSTQNLYELFSDGCKSEKITYFGAFDFDHPLAQSEYAKAVGQYRKWIQNGSHGSMTYLERGFERRKNPKIVFPDLKSVAAFAIPYSAKPGFDASVGPKWARYLAGKDYHQVVVAKLQKIANQVGLEKREYKICVDTSAVLERTLGALAGLGWIGKNGMLIHPQMGSYFFIGIIFLARPFHRAPHLMPNYCGHCEKCLVGCPTQAFEAPRVLNSKKCISYWTLENRAAEIPIPLDGWIAGCDLCQEVCPFNKKSSLNPSEPDFKHWPKTWDEWAKESADQYNQRTKDSALNRVSYSQMIRNLRRNSVTKN